MLHLRHYLAFSILAFSAASRLQAQQIEIIDFGIYKGRVVEIINEPNSPTGKVRTIETDLYKETTAIPAEIGTKFGFRFKVMGTSDPTKTVPLRFKFDFPEMTNPETGEKTSSYEVSGDVPVAPQGMFWDLVHPWELLPGKWTMKIFSKNQILAEKEFTVTATN